MPPLCSPPTAVTGPVLSLHSQRATGEETRLPLSQVEAFLLEPRTVFTKVGQEKQVNTIRKRLGMLEAGIEEDDLPELLQLHNIRRPPK